LGCYRGGSWSFTAFVSSAGVERKFDLLSDFQTVELPVGDSRVMKEYVGSVVRGNKSETFVLHKLLDGTRRHAKHSPGAPEYNTHQTDVRPQSPECAATVNYPPGFHSAWSVRRGKCLFPCRRVLCVVSDRYRPMALNPRRFTASSASGKSQRLKPMLGGSLNQAGTACFLLNQVELDRRQNKNIRARAMLCGLSTRPGEFK
jgi:hypothetical protein